MKKYIHNRIMLLLALCFSCCCIALAGSSTPHVEIANNITAKEQLSPQEVITRFLKWYKANYKKATSFPILVKDTTGNFMVDTSAAHSYLGFLESSGLISARYMQFWQVFFNDKAVLLKDNPVNTDIPEDFDFDFVLITQQPSIVFKNIDRIRFKTISINRNTALLRVSLPGAKGMQYEFELYKGKSGWQIGYISTPNFD